MDNNSFEEIMLEFNRFLGNIHEIDTDITEDINELLCIDRLFELIRIARITVEVSNNSPVSYSIREREVQLTFYEKPNYDAGRIYKVTKKNGKENTVILHIYPYIGESEWTKFELDTINSIVNVLYMYNGVFNLTKLTKRLVYYDIDLNIPNLPAFNKRISELVAKKQIGEYGTCRFNIKRFSKVNSLVGIPRGSVIMKKYITELQRILGNDGIIYRIGGDNFIILFKLELYIKVKEYLSKATLKTGFEDVPEITITSCAGFFLETKKTKSVDSVLQITHKIGMMAKENKYTDIMLFDETINKREALRNRILEMFPDSIKNEDFLVYYQPKYDSRHSKIIGAEALCRWFIPHELIEVELTETTTDVDFNSLKKTVFDLNKVGINTTVDDFGIGYSSLSIIRDLPWKVLKLDRSFLPTKNDIQFNEKKNILKHVIAMANELGLECFAEGAEELEQINLLNECGCYFIQGFYYSKPLPKAEFENKLISK